MANQMILQDIRAAERNLASRTRVRSLACFAVDSPEVLRIQKQIFNYGAFGILRVTRWDDKLSSLRLLNYHLLLLIRRYNQGRGILVQISFSRYCTSHARADVDRQRFVNFDQVERLLRRHVIAQDFFVVLFLLLLLLEQRQGKFRIGLRWKLRAAGEWIAQRRCRRCRQIALNSGDFVIFLLQQCLDFIDNCFVITNDFADALFNNLWSLQNKRERQ